jgi:hypothetical protein
LWQNQDFIPPPVDDIESYIGGGRCFLFTLGQADMLTW